MSEQPEGTMRDIADDGTQENPTSATDGGRSSRGPSLSTSGEQEMGGAVPPYEGRQESGEIDDKGAGPYQDGVHTGGAAGPVSSESEGTDRAEPSESPGGATTSPAEEFQGGNADGESDPGVGPSHVAGTGRAEDKT